MSNKEPVSIIMVPDARLESENNGAAVVHWLSEETLRLYKGARGFRLDWNVLSIDTNCEIKVVARKSLDKRSYTYFGMGIAGSQSVDGQPSGITATGQNSFVYAQSADDFLEYVQLGIKVRNNTDTTLVGTRLVMVATILFGNVTAQYGLASGTAITGASGDVTSVFDGTNFDKLSVIMTYAGATPSGLTFLLKGSSDNTAFATLDTTAALSSAPDTAAGFVLKTDYPCKYMKVTYATGTASLTASAKLIGRVA